MYEKIVKVHIREIKQKRNKYIMNKEKSSTLSSSDFSRSQSSSQSNNIYGSDESISISQDNIKISEIISD